MKFILLSFLFLVFFSNAFSQVKLDSGLVAYYPFSGNANDSTGHGNNPTFNNATLTSDINGNANSAYHFDGSTSYMQIPNSAWLNMGTKISLSVNVKPLGFYTGKCRGNDILQKGNSDGIPGNYILRFSDTLDPCDNVSTTNEHFYGVGGAHSSSVVELNKWYNIVWTYDGATARIYINGVLSGSAASTIGTFTNSYDLFLGRLNDSQYPYWFNGDMDEVRIYNRALTAQEAQALAISYPAPTITSFSPTTGGANSSIVITGTNFTGATAVSFGGVKAASFNVNFATKITAKVGAGASGSVSVTTPGGTATLAGFTYCLVPSVKIVANKNSPFCAGTVVTFTATAVNGGSTPMYQWMKNNVAVGTNSNTYSDSLLQKGDTVFCQLTSNASPCVTTSTVSSGKLTFTVTPLVTPFISIVANPSTPVCLGANVSFTATPVNGGAAPSYQWMKNGMNAGSNSTVYTDSLAKDGDSIVIILTSNAACPTTAAATSDGVKLTVNTPNPVISIAANNDTTICSATKVTFTATVNPVYLWKKDGVTVGNSTNIYTDSMLKNGDNVQCFLVSSAAACNSNASNIINSNQLKFVVNAAPAKPSSISGPSNVKVGQQGIYFSITPVAGVTYAWKLPTGALIDSGQGGYQIKVDWGSVGGKLSVMAISSCGTSAASTKTVGVVPAFMSTIKSSNTDNSATVDNDVKLYPNPAGAWTTLQFSSKVPGKYVITILDAQNKVLEIKTGVSLKGNNTVKINTAKYAKGTYFISIVDEENGQRSKKLVVGEAK